MKIRKINRSSTLCGIALGAVLMSASAQAATITGVTIEDFSSEIFDAINAVNGSGFDEVNGTHSTDAAHMFSTTGTYQGGTDTLGAYPNSYIEFDLEANYDLASTTVWNWNYAGLTNRGANAVTISVAEAVGGPFTSLGNFTFAEAPGNATTDFGETHILSGANNVRLVRFDITTNHGDTTQFAALSEVRFDGTAIPEPSAALLGGLGLLALLRRRR